MSSPAPGAPTPSSPNDESGDRSQNTSYAQVPTSPTSADFLPSPTPPESSRSRFVSSPLNPNAPEQRGVPGASNEGRTRPSSWNSSFLLDNATPLPADTPTSSDGSHSEKAQMKGVMSGAIGGGFTPYPTHLHPNPNTDFGPVTGGPFRGSLLSTRNSRFSTASSVGSVLSFASDSKYAWPTTGVSTAAFLAYKPEADADPRASFFPAEEFGPYERMDGPADDDDYMHDPAGRNPDTNGFNWRGFLNVAVLLLVIAVILTLFAGYPIISEFTRDLPWKDAHVNGTGQVPQLFAIPDLIDPQTPEDVKTRKGLDGEDYVLVFSDEFETPGRSFYPGDDPFWEAVDLHYWATGDLEWYDPGQITTRDGALVIVLEQQDTHDLKFKSGMLQSWNKFCFTTGYIEVSVIFPGSEDVSGYWPGAWVMGNLGRPGYGATTEGTWPYTYDTCDVGVLPNQTRTDGTPLITKTAGGNKKYGNNLSWLPGQKLSACTCPGEDHPGPSNNMGRGVPEIDIFETQKNKVAYGGRVTQSAQMAPFSNLYYFANTSADIHMRPGTVLNEYRGSALQQAISALTNLNASSYAYDANPTYTKFGFEYWSNPDKREEGFIDWVANNEVFHVTQKSFAGDPTVEISDRLVAEEPMSIILNLAVAESFQKVDLESMRFPAEFKIDYIRVWQRKGLDPKESLSCDPKRRPTAKYINDHAPAYQNANYTSWAAAGYSWPKNSLKDGVC